MKALFVALTLCLLPISATGLDFDVEGDTLYLSDEIYTSDLAEMRQALRDNPDLKTIVLEDVPGSNDDATNVQIIRLIRKAGLNTHLTSDSFVASGGTDLFLSGVQRTMERGAEIGVHSWSDGTRDGADVPQSSAEHDLFLNLYRDLGIPLAFYWFTLNAASAQDMHFMSDTEINKFGLLTAPIGTKP